MNNPKVANQRPSLPVIGRVERATFPLWRVFNLPAKVDTGARTSALHVTNIHELQNNRVRFTVVVDPNHPDSWISTEAPISRRTRVRSSSGAASERLFVKTLLRLGTKEREVEVNLVNRSDMRFRMLIGRSSIAGIFVVDVRRRFLLPSQTVR